MNNKNKILVLLFVLINVTSQSRTVNFKLEQYNFCPKLKKLAKLNPNTTITIDRDGLHAVGSGNLPEDVTKPLEVTMKTMKCENQNNCVDENMTTIPGICRFIEYIPMINKGLGDFFIPRIRCPVKHGDYLINFTVTLDQFGMLPIGTALRKIKIIFNEVHGPTKKRLVLCLGGLVKTQAYSFRKN